MRLRSPRRSVLRVTTTGLHRTGLDGMILLYGQLHQTMATEKIITVALYPLPTKTPAILHPQETITPSLFYLCSTAPSSARWDHPRFFLSVSHCRTRWKYPQFLCVSPQYSLELPTVRFSLFRHSTSRRSSNKIGTLGLSLIHI